MIMLCHKYPFLIKSLFYSFIITIHLLLRTCVAKNHCPPSSCGNITDISYPFRLKNDPKHCGNPNYELACEDNTTVIYLQHSLKYVVREINYALHTIRIADPAIKENDSCSFPNYSLSRDSFVGNQYTIDHDFDTGPITFVTFMSCPYPVMNNSLLLEPAAHCGHGFNESPRKHTYIKLGDLNGSYIRDNCTIDRIVMTSVSLCDALSVGKSEKTSVSLSEIHIALLHGLEVSWIYALCDDGCDFCIWDGERARCDIGGHWCGVAKIWWFRCGSMPLWFVSAFSTAWSAAATSFPACSSRLAAAPRLHSVLVQPISTTTRSSARSSLLGSQLGPAASAQTQQRSSSRFSPLHLSRTRPELQQTHGPHKNPPQSARDVLHLQITNQQRNGQ